MANTPAARKWTAIVSRQQSSGLSVRQYARDHGVNPNTLAWWRWELARRGEAAQPEFLELSVVQPGAGQPTASALPGVELRLAAYGAQFTVTSSTDLALLRRVLEALC